jgi:hypothetical protein
MKIERVTSWSAETPDGLYYAEKSTKGRKWSLRKTRGRDRRLIGVFASFKAMAAHVGAEL